MSRGFNFRFKTIHEFIDNEINQLPIKLKIFCFGFIISSHFCYSIGTKKEEIITIHKKYKFIRNGFTEFMIIDKNGRHYNINNSLWYWKWNSIEDWSLMKNNSKIAIRYYGWRVPMFGVFPNIIYSKKIKDKKND